MGIITLLTDFGTREPYVGVMKGVMASINPAAVAVDLTHEVPPGDVALASFFQAEAFKYFPTGTIHVVVVDPGVGTARRAVAVECGGHVLVGPDNGVLGGCLGDAPWNAVELIIACYHWAPVSSTFHGRDIFSPVAAHPSLGVELKKFGPPALDLVRCAPPTVTVSGQALAGQVMHVDTFGNALTNVSHAVFWDWLGVRDPQSVVLQCGGLLVTGLHATFGNVAPQAGVAYLGSSGVLELAVRNGNAALQMGCTQGATVTLKTGQPTASR